MRSSSTGIACKDWITRNTPNNTPGLRSLLNSCIFKNYAAKHFQYCKRENYEFPTTLDSKLESLQMRFLPNTQTQWRIFRFGSEHEFIHRIEFCTIDVIQTKTILIIATPIIFHNKTRLILSVKLDFVVVPLVFGERNFYLTFFAKLFFFAQKIKMITDYLGFYSGAFRFQSKMK